MQHAAADAVQFPLALPVIMASLRVATVSTVALTTIGTIVAYGGLGNLLSEASTPTSRRRSWLPACCASCWPSSSTSCSWSCSGSSRRGRAMPGDVVDYIFTSSNWQGSTGIGTFAVQQILLTITALAVAIVIGLPLALSPDTGRGGFLAINISNVGRAIPVFAVLLSWRWDRSAPSTSGRTAARAWPP